jgi:hypothetical protein
MSTQAITSTVKLHSQWLFYIENELSELAVKDIFTIDHYGDSEIFNPDVQQQLKQCAHLFTSVEVNIEAKWALGFRELYELKQLDVALVQTYQQFKTWTRKLISELLGAINWKHTSTKDITALVFSHMLPYFEAAGGVPSPLLNIVLAVIARFIRR